MMDTDAPAAAPKPTVAQIITGLADLSVAVRDMVDHAKLKTPEQRDREIRRRLATSARDLRRAVIPAAVLGGLSLEQLRQVDRMVADLRALATRKEPFA